MSCIHPHGPCRRVLGDEPDVVDDYCVPCLRNNLRKVRTVLKEERRTHAFFAERMDEQEEAQSCVTCGGSICPPLECETCTDRSIAAGNRTTIQRHAAIRMMQDRKEEMSNHEGENGQFQLQHGNELVIRAVDNGFLISTPNSYRTPGDKLPPHRPSAISPSFRELVEFMWENFYKHQGEEDSALPPCPLLVPEKED
jgi:hypothetical protein